jgi:PhnB protein
MTTINCYLNFNGNCEEAFNFYKSVFGGDFGYIGRYKDMPPKDGKSVTGKEGEKIMHVSLPISKETILMGSDASEEFGGKVNFGNNISISITTDSQEKADMFYKKLSAGGQPFMPMSNTFWGSYWGMLADKFGITWMVSFDQNQQAQQGNKTKETATA